jgi:D-alanyl-D-alanine carboxypeptidase
VRRYRLLLHFLVSVLFLVSLTLSASAQGDLSPEIREKIDTLANQVLTRTGVPSASIAIVKDNQIVYVKAYGDARLEPRTPATPEMRYSIGSISKQFTAAAILLLQEQGKLSLDDKVARFLPNLSRAKEVTIRQLLSHTSGYQDYWPQDYVMPMMLQPVTAEKIMNLWARKPLDFEPGTKWQYSNTNYVIAGVIIEKVSGKPLLQFLSEKIFTPLGMKSVANIDKEKLGETDPVGYLRYALGPLRPAPKEGKGWLFAAGELAMTARELALWDISILDQKLLKPSSYRELETEVLLKNGLGTRYGLGVSLNTEAGTRAVSHGGEVSGFTAENLLFPEKRIAIVALTNQDAAGAAGAIAHGIAPFLLASDDANAYFSEQALKDFAAGLQPLGTPQDFVQVNQGLRGGMISRSYRIRFANGRILRAWTFEMPDGKLEQYQIAEN